MSKKVIHLTGLNGLRAIAALAVVFAHITISLPSFNLDASIFGYSQDGIVRGMHLAGFGVSVFFSLSGFLITYLLLLEKEKQPINVKKFYVRRILRIQPLYFLYLFVTLPVLYLLGINYPAAQIIFFLFFAANVPFITGNEIPYLGHYWSLGVEEQFYIFYPWIVKHSKNVLFTLVGFTLLLIVIKTICRLIDIKYGYSLPYNIIHVTRFQCMLIGAMGGYLYYTGNEIFLRLSTRILIQLISWTALVLTAFNSFHIVSFLDNEIISLLTVFLIVGQATKRNNIINLDNFICDFLGKISYGIYVIHPLIVLLLSYSIKELDIYAPVKYVATYAVIFVLTIFAAYLSYNYFEKLFLKLKNKYSDVKSSGTKYSFE